MTTTVVVPLLPSEEMCWNLVFQYVKTFFERLGALSGAIWTIYKVQPVPAARPGFATKVRTQFAWDNFLGC
ncbi:hypothetical protein PG985_011504 [Apiospora marii]|uniref:uncharacterized protein n=1 Tax=Apiospora marii TaxID=335849 RepID=UPI0031325349